MKKILRYLARLFLEGFVVVILVSLALVAIVYLLKDRIIEFIEGF